MSKALEKSQLKANDIDYVNAHGTGSALGDKTEIEALSLLNMQGVKINSTKSIVGHGLSASGIVECIATLVQMKENVIHPSINIDEPISNQFDFNSQLVEDRAITNAMSNNFGFGGVNTSIIIQKT
jgi:malonyl-ACP decarboxylase